MVTYRNANNNTDLAGILSLQQANLFPTVGPEVAKDQGFVTLVHDLPILKAMNADYGHSVAIFEEEVVGYALMMQLKFEHNVSALYDFIEQLKRIKWQQQSLSDYRYFIMGQVCIAKAFRGQGIFAGLYTHLCQRLGEDFDLVITDIAARNTRSCAAHFKIGFKEMGRFLAEDGQEWIIVGKHCQE